MTRQSCPLLFFSKILFLFSAWHPVTKFRFTFRQISINRKVFSARKYCGSRILLAVVEYINLMTPCMFHNTDKKIMNVESSFLFWLLICSTHGISAPGNLTIAKMVYIFLTTNGPCHSWCGISAIPVTSVLTWKYLLCHRSVQIG